MTQIFKPRRKIKLFLSFLMAIFLTLGLSLASQSVLAISPSAIMKTSNSGITIGGNSYNFAEGQNLIWEVLGSGSSGTGSFALFQKPDPLTGQYADKFRVDHNGNVTAAGNVAAAGFKTSLNCSNANTSKLLTDANGNIVCGTDQSGGGGSGTVTSITAGSGLSGSVNPITTTGTISLNLANPNTWTGTQTFGTLQTSQASFSGNTINTKTGVSEIAVNYNSGAGKGFTVYDSATTPLLRVDSAGDVSVTNKLTVSGNVGIGTISPGAKLEVAGAGGTNIDTILSGRLQVGGASDGGVWVDSNRTMFMGAMGNGYLGWWGKGATWNLVMNKANGKVGIGTVSPNTKLNLYDGASGPIIDLQGLTAKYRGIKIADTSNNENWFAGANDSNNYIIRSSGSSDVLTIGVGTGNVGVGTTNLAQKLQVNGNILLEAGGSKIGFNNDIVNYNISGVANGIQLNSWSVGNFNFTGGDGIWSFTNGSVGIGTPTPGAKLEVAGQVKITGGTPGVGKVLTSDNNGLASWQATSEWFKIDTGSSPSGAGSKIRIWYDGVDHSPSAMCQNNGYTAATGACKGSAVLPGFLGITSSYEGSIMSNNTSSGDWAFTCKYGEDTWWYADTNTLILCVK